MENHPHLLFKCGCCGEKVPQLFEVRNPKGNGIGLFGSCCHGKVIDAVDRLANLYGAYIVGGAYQCSPRGTPNVTSYTALIAAIEAKERDNETLSA